MKTINASVIEDAFGDTIAGRGHDYYRKGRVIHVMKMRNTIYAEVGGSTPEPYSVEVDLETLESICTCPYSDMCKHGAAALYHVANDGEVADGAAIIGDLRKQSKGELIKLLENLVLSNPSLISELTFQKGGAKDVNHMVVEFGRRVSSTYNFAAQQQEIHRLDRVITKNVLGLPAGEEKAGLIIRFLEEIKEYFNEVDDSNGTLAGLTDECIETLAEELDSLREEKRADIVKRLKKLEEDDEYGYFDYVADVLEGGEKE
jgi:uncharacterized Zn finger protein